MKDWCGKEGAQNLARRLRVYWQERGYGDVSTEVGVALGNPADKSGMVYSVRTNMKNGYPPKPGRSR